jgi:hypothetical protein
MSFGNALAVDLASGTGLSVQAAELIGAGALTTLAGVGTAQSGGKAIPKWTTNVLATTASGQTAFVLPSDAPLEVAYSVVNSTSDAALVFPPTSGTINAVSANGSVSIAINVARIFIRKSTNRWVSFLAA